MGNMGSFAGGAPRRLRGPGPAIATLSLLLLTLVGSSGSAGVPLEEAKPTAGPALASPSGDPSSGWYAPAETSLPQSTPGLLPADSTSARYDPPAPGGHFAADAGGEPSGFQLFPEGLIYRSYLAGMKEPRFAGMWVHDVDQGWLLEAALGARIGIVRLGTTDPRRPDGWEIDAEGAVFPRFDTTADRSLVSADYRIGIPLTFGAGPFQTKLAWYHLSSHLGDEFMLAHPGVQRINYSRDAIVWGNSLYLTEDLRLYAEAEWAFYNDGGSEPWAFQFGVDYSPAEPVGSLRGAPFVALNAHLREEVDFGGNVVVQTGWQWRGQSGHLFRFGMQYFTGKSDQFEFFRRTEDRLGLGIWFDF